MRTLQVVLVGRPNVGKSSVFNWLVRKRLAIVDPVAGVTRDRVTQQMSEDDRRFELVDMGGIGVNDVDNLDEEIQQQICYGIESADVILLVVDARAGLLPLDEEVAERLRGIDQPVICVANKADGTSLDSQADEFYRLGRGKPIRVSTLQNRNRHKLLDAILESLPAASDEPDDPIEEPVMKAAIVGRRNVGKSTLVNTLAGVPRMIVSEVPGTTRDSVNVRFELDGKVFVAIDTPGLRRVKSVKTDVDFYGMHRAQRSIRYADVVLMFFSAVEPISKVDKQLCSYVEEQYKPCLFVINKWDLLHGQRPTEDWVKYLRETFPNLWQVPIAFITAATGKNVKNLVNHAQMLFKQSRERVATGELNRLIHAAVARHAPPLYRNQRPKIFYVTQVGIQPPTIVLKCNHPKGFSTQYRRYLLSVLRDQLPFGEVPIKLHLRGRARGDERENIAARVDAPHPADMR